MDDLFRKWDVQDTIVPYINVDKFSSLDERLMEEQIDKFGGETTFEQVYQRNIEKDIVGKEAALLSIASKCILFKNPNSIDVTVQGKAAGGVHVTYPVNASSSNTSGKSTTKDVVSQQKVLWSSST